MPIDKKLDLLTIGRVPKHDSLPVLTQQLLFQFLGGQQSWAAEIFCYFLQKVLAS